MHRRLTAGRGDRQPEFTQLDIEMSFVQPEDIFPMVEGMMARVFREVRGVELETPFSRLSWEEAMSRYGTDKPDLRFGLELVELSDLFRDSDVAIFSRALAAGGIVKGLRVPGAAGPAERAKRSPFLDGLHPKDLTRLAEAYYGQVIERKTVIMATVIDKRYLRDYMNHEQLHKKAYELLLERIQHYMREYHAKHQALIMMDDTSTQLNRAVAMKHAFFQRVGNQNMGFPSIVEYPFFTRSELSNGVQLADLLAYDVYRAFREEDFEYPYFKRLLPNFYWRRNGSDLAGLLGRVGSAGFYLADKR